MTDNKIVIINQSSGYLTFDIIEAFEKTCKDVTLLASNDPSSDNSLNFISITPYDKKNIYKRFISWVKGYRDIKKYLSTLKKNEYILFFTNPPFSYFAISKFKNPFSIIIYDLYPDALNNIKCPGIIKKYWVKKNRQIFKRADKIFTLSEGMKTEVEKYVEKSKIEVAPLWSKQIKPDIIEPEDNKFIIENRLQNKFLILYSGNMGLTHNLEPLIEIASSLKEYDDIEFIFIGEGGKKQKLIEMVNRLNLTNCKFYPYLPAEDLKYSLSAASLGVVSVSKETANISVPSKTFNLLSYGVPIIALAPEKSEISRLIHKYKFGISTRRKDIEEIKKWILRCKNDKDLYLQLKDNAKETAKNFTKENAKIIVKAIEKRGYYN